jgi:hypothetical protein
MFTKRLFAVTALAASALFGFSGAAVATDLPNDNWSCQNPAGNEVMGECNGVPLDVVNPGGNTPPAWQGR